MVHHSPPALRLPCECVSNEDVINHKVKAVPDGNLGTLEYRLNFLNAEGRTLSPWHSIPLYAGGDLLNFVCEIPRNTSAKFEVSTSELGNPIKQDAKKGKPRHYAVNIPWNYGMLPQTWEDPTHANEDCEGCLGDNDPVDIVEIGDNTGATGEVYAVKPVAAFAMIDEGELDWKVVAISSNDPRCHLVSNEVDVEKHFPGTLSAIREWFRIYKTFDGKPENKFALQEKAMGREYTLRMIAETHTFWKAMVQRARTNAPGVKLMVGDVPITAPCLVSIDSDTDESSFLNSPTGSGTTGDFTSALAETVKGVLESVDASAPHGMKRHPSEGNMKHKDIDIECDHGSKRLELSVAAA
eukprot:jgi/Mesen1/3537/ME000198S02736